MANQKKSTTNRRSFLLNSGLTALGLGFSSSLSFGSVLKAQGGKSNADCELTTKDYYGQGPFYTKDAPTISNNQLAAKNEPGERMIISGRVLNEDCTKGLANAEIDIWHANAKGEYDNDGFNLRGITKTNAEGFYEFESIYPGKYLNGARYRPAHLHFKIRPKEGDELTTQLYFKGDEDLDSDAASSITSGIYDATNRIIELTKNTDDKLEGIWNVAMANDGTMGANDLHLNKGILYEVSPNPFTERVHIHLGLFLPALVNITIYNLQGKKVDELNLGDLPAAKHKINWKFDSEIEPGIYFLTLTMHDLQVHYLKIIKS